MAIAPTGGIRAFVLCMLAVAGLSACITTEVGRVPAQAEEEEAAGYNMQLGVEYLRQNKLELARQKLQKAIEQDPNLAAAHSYIAMIYDRIGDSREAEKHYRRAVRLAPNDPDALNALAIFLCGDNENHFEALSTFERALSDQLYPRRTMLYTNAGVCARRINGERAEAYFRSALSLDRNYGPALEQLADLSIERDLLLQARAFIERYLATDQVSPEILWLGVKVETQMGDERAAGKYADRLVNEYPDSVEARRVLEGDRDD